MKPYRRRRIPTTLAAYRRLPKAERVAVLRDLCDKHHRLAWHAPFTPFMRKLRLPVLVWFYVTGVANHWWNVHDRAYRWLLRHRAREWGCSIHEAKVGTLVVVYTTLPDLLPDLPRIPCSFKDAVAVIPKMLVILAEADLAWAACTETSEEFESTADVPPGLGAYTADACDFEHLVQPPPTPEPHTFLADLPHSLAAALKRWPGLKERLDRFTPGQRRFIDHLLAHRGLSDRVRDARLRKCDGYTKTTRDRIWQRLGVG